ncbi:hypothetical protein XA68_17799 [Ophiocordyceps unilateralis]|uniref:DUF7924 domain-containing protein n=1 Tax=Ophiocordyceps unilateralis TaxID=268505 RepID=A0A2A9PKE3_OPHUN|nr:hypothetical protein XA68_17799 [Ophiocordyceps unilateralis]
MARSTRSFVAQASVRSEPRKVGPRAPASTPEAHCLDRAAAKAASLPSSSKSRKRRCHDKDPSNHPFKHPRTSPHPPSPLSPEPLVIDSTDPVAFWINQNRWPPRLFEPASHMERVLARKKSSASLKRSEPGSASFVTPSDQKPREEKSAPYHDPRYKPLLETKGVFDRDSDLGITDESRQMTRTLLENVQPTPGDTLFRDDIFHKTLQSVCDTNKARVIRDFTPLLVPSAETLAIRGKAEMECLVETLNEGWNNSIPLTNPRPQPDYCVGFKRMAFSDTQLENLSPFIGDWLNGDQSFFMASFKMLFPFLTCEVQCGLGMLRVADNQNAHSTTLAVRAIVELFRLVKREDEINRQILAFSISHDEAMVTIAGHYPEIKGAETKYYRHVIRRFAFAELDGREKWSSYIFTMNVYELWMPAHFARICSAIDQLPSHLEFGVPPLGHLESRRPTDSAVDSAAEAHSDQPEVTSITSLTVHGGVGRL